MTTNVLYIDLREETEILDTQILSKSPNISVMNIPTRNIFANVEFINDMSQGFDLVYLICRSGRRSQQVKDKYFANNERIQSYDGGWKALEKNSNNVSVNHSYSLQNMSPQQYMQSVIVLFMLSMIGLLYFNFEKKYVMIALGVFATFISHQVLTKDCLMTQMIPLSDEI